MHVVEFYAGVGGWSEALEIALAQLGGEAEVCVCVCVCVCMKVC